jgi:hypothetical protein
MTLQIQKDLRRSKRKLSTFLDLPDSPFLSQNPSISTPAKKKKLFSFSQSQPTRHIQEIPIYSELPIPEDSESAVEMQNSQKFVKISKKTSFDLSQHTSLSSIHSRTPLEPKDTNLQLSQIVVNYIRKPDQKISWGCVKK